MRPVIRGEHPKDENDNRILFTDYSCARLGLIIRLGQYCSYCEMKLDSSLAVEHVQPKCLYPHNTLTWNNFLLSCPNCNATKKATDINDSTINNYIFPDRDNSFRAFRYSEGGMIKPTDLNETIKEKASKTIRLCGLDKQPLNDPKASDRRWSNRRIVWDLAQRAKKRLEENNYFEMREQIIETALGNAYWSIWMTVFEDDADMLKRLIDAFPGTAGDCFDENDGCKSIQRFGGLC